MGGTNNKPGKAKGKAKPAKKQSSLSSTTSTSTKERPKTRDNATTSEDLSADADFFSSLNTLPADLQQVLLNIFKHGLSPSPSSDSSSSSSKKESGEGNEDSDNKPTEGDINAQIQQLKTHLYNRDFVSAFTDATPSLLRAYALRWSASRSLAYCGLFKAVLLLESRCSGQSHQLDDSHFEKNINALCIGGGAGAEIVALAGAWRLIGGDEGKKIANSSNNSNNNRDQQSASSSPVQAIESLSLENSAVTLNEKATRRKLSITAVDIAEWSDVVDRLAEAIQSPEVPGKKSYATPLIRNLEDHKYIDIKFRKLDVLTLSDENLRSLVLDQQVISLMFTLNELFSTSISKTTHLLLKITDFTNPGTILMVVDSPGSYSTLSFSKDGSSSTQQQQQQQQQQRQYPMKFLLDHALINVAEGKWEKIVAEDSKWFRKDASHNLQYNVDLGGGQGYIKLEDMRFQIHVYRRLPSPKGMESPR